MPYQLEYVLPTKAPAYKQLLRFYEYQEDVKGLSDNSMECKTRTVNDFIRFCGITDLRKLTNEHLDRWVADQRRRGNKAVSINVRVCHVRTMVEWQLEEHLKIRNFKLSRIEKQAEGDPERHWYDRDQITRVLACADRREWLLIKLCFDCGFRISELQNLRMRNINGHEISIRGKRRRQRFCMISEETYTRLQDWIQRERITDYLWPSALDRNEPISANALRDKMKKVFAQAGFPEFTPHDLRRSYAADLQNLNIPIRQIQAALGHFSVKTTEKYLQKLTIKEIKPVYDKKFSIVDPRLR